MLVRRRMEDDLRAMFSHDGIDARAIRHVANDRLQSGPVPTEFELIGDGKEPVLIPVQEHQTFRA